MTDIYKVKNKKTGLFLKSRAVPSVDNCSGPIPRHYLSERYLWDSLGHEWKRLDTAKQRYRALAVLEDRHKNKTHTTNFTLDDIEIVKFELQIVEVDNLNVDLDYEKYFALAFDQFSQKSIGGIFNHPTNAADRAMLSYLGIEDPNKNYSYSDWSKPLKYHKYPKKKKQSDKSSWKCYDKFPVMCVRLSRRGINVINKIKITDIKAKLEESGFNWLAESSVFYLESIEPTVLLYLTSDPDTQYFIFEYDNKETNIESLTRMAQEFKDCVKGKNNV